MDLGLKKSLLKKLAVYVIIVALVVVWQYSGWPWFADWSKPVRPARAATVYLTTGTSWTVPINWNDADNSIEVIGGGGGGGNGVGNQGSSGGGGGGGAYAIVSNVDLTPNSSVTIQIGAGGAAQTAGTATFFDGANCGGSAVCGPGGGAASGGTAGSGGLFSGGTGDSGFNGGTGGSGASGAVGNGGYGGGGGGGAAGLYANGSNGIAPANTTGGNGGQGDGTSGGAGGSGALGGNPGNTGGTGGNGQEWDLVYGTGGGGGGAGGGDNPNRDGGTGGLGGRYGAGGGGGGAGGRNSSASSSGGAGRDGLIIVTYTPLPSTLDVIASSSMSFNAPLNVEFYSQTSTMSDVGAIQVSDIRGSSAGWTLNITGNDWKYDTGAVEMDYDGGGADDNLGKLCPFPNNANLYFEWGSLTGVSKGANDCFSTTVSTIDVVTATVGNGTGVYWLTDMPLEQFIPANPKAQEYTTTVIFTIQ